MAEAEVSAWRRLQRVAWQAPLFAVPFAIFFGTLFGRGLEGYLGAYGIAFTFTVVIFLFQWATGCFLIPRLGSRVSSSLEIGLVHALMGIAGSFVAAVIIHLYVMPGFLGSARRFAVFGMFSLLFAVLITAVLVAWNYHRSAIDNARREKELELARRIQHSFLPESFPEVARVEVHAVNVPSRGVSGDFYDVVPAEGGLVLAVADVEGKSIPAALLTAMLQASLRTQTPNVGSTAAIVANVNALVCRRSSSLQQFATFFLARMSEDGRLTYTNAGHNPPLLLRAGGELLPLERGGVMLGVMEGLPYEEESFALAAGDRLLVYTDGISERANPRGEEFGPARLEALLRALPREASAREIIARTLKLLDEFSEGVEPADDQTLLVLRVR